MSELIGGGMNVRGLFRTRRLVAAAALTAASLTHAQTRGTWIGPASGTWSNAANWSSNPLFPNSGGEATFERGAATVTVDTSVSISTLHLNSAGRTMIQGPGSLNFIGPLV